MTANIALNESQFRALVAGGIVRDSAMLGGQVALEATLFNAVAIVNGIVVKIILSDIGFAAMRKAIDDAEAAQLARLKAEEI